MKFEIDKFFPYLTIIGVVAIVAIVSLVMTNITGAVTLPIGKEVVDSSVVGCIDLEPANDYYVRGLAQQGPTKYYDYCQDDVVFQWDCSTSNTVKRTHGFTCPSGCQSGLCK